MVAKERNPNYIKPKLTPMEAIDAFCKGCIYDPTASGSVAAQVQDCRVVKRPLFEYRKVTTKAGRRAYNLPQAHPARRGEATGLIYPDG